MIIHQPGCVLDAVYWLRHAVAAAGYLTQNDPPEPVDRVSAASLTDTLAHFAELDDWAEVTLRDVANHATLMNQDRFKDVCTCGAFKLTDGTS